MTSLTPGMETALAADTPIIFGALEIALPGYTLRLLDGAGSLVLGGQTYTGRDATYGTLSAIDALDDGVGDQAPGLGITLQPASDASAAILAGADIQGAPVILRLGAVNRATGAVIPDPAILFVGEIDVPTLRVSKSQRVLDYECVSSFERLFENDEGVRLSDAHHKMVWPGELGLANVTAVTKKVYWGTEGAGGAISR